MRRLRYGYWWLGGGIALIAYVIYATLSPGGGAVLLNDKAAHFTAFAVLMGWFSGVFRPAWFPLVALLLALLGVGIELLQAQLTYRTAEVEDALFNCGGIVVAWTLALAGLGSWTEIVEGRLPR